ncbi:hypothetical protein BDZ89DRAFT_1046364 [Hymenopellis radicata]|nr:hypothetical protein BDZ89DRAFT_1046364 [Hymenopellis radicata]
MIPGLEIERLTRPFTLNEWARKGHLNTNVGSARPHAPVNDTCRRRRRDGQSPTPEFIFIDIFPPRYHSPRMLILRNEEAAQQINGKTMNGPAIDEYEDGGALLSRKKKLALFVKAHYATTARYTLVLIEAAREADPQTGVDFDASFFTIIFFFANVESESLPNVAMGNDNELAADYDNYDTVAHYVWGKCSGLAGNETPNPRKTLPRAAKGTFWPITIIHVNSLAIIGLLVPYTELRTSY